MTNKQLILLHIFGCVCFLTLPLLFFPHPRDITNSFSNPAIIRDIIGQIILIGFFYLLYYLLIPKFYYTKRNGIFILLVVVSFLLSILLPSLLTGHFNQPDSFTPPGAYHPDYHPPFQSFDDSNPPPDSAGFTQLPAFERDRFRNRNFVQQNTIGSTFYEEVSHHIFLFLVVLFFSMMVSLNNRWKQAKKEKTDAELSYLKAQINPHFLFNTLNSIYSLIIQKSDAAADAIVKLAGMMRYVLYETDRNFVMLEKEVSYLQDFVDLQKLRFGSQVPVTFTINGKAEGKQIAPLLLISFVENAFKHGVNAEEKSEIIIHLDMSDNNVVLKVHNNKVQVDHWDVTGIGLQNAKNRLQFIYPDKHILIIEDTVTCFFVKLQISLS